MPHSSSKGAKVVSFKLSCRGTGMEQQMSSYLDFRGSNDGDCKRHFYVEEFEQPVLHRNVKVAEWWLLKIVLYFFKNSQLDG